jgi:hypothetical protein
MSLLLLLTGQNEGPAPQPSELDLLYKPVRDLVARLLRNRLYAGGGRTPAFLNDDEDGGPTDPTRDEVDGLIDDAAADVASKVGVDLPESVHPIARRVVSIGTALLIEVGSENYDTDRYDRLKTLYDERLGQLLDAAQDEQTGGELGDADDRIMAAGSFSPAGGTCVAGTEHSWGTIGKTGLGGFEC